jgi:hypothetical protein
MATQTASPPAAAPARPRWWLRLMLGAMVVLLLAWLAPWLVGLSPLRNVIAQRIFGNLKGQISVGGAALGWFSPLHLSDVVVTDTTGRPLLTAPRIASSRTLLSLLLDRSDLGSFLFERPMLDIALSNKQSNLEEVCADWFEPAEPKPPAAEEIRPRTALKVVFQEARARITDGASTSELVFEPLRLAYDVPAERSLPIELVIEATQ